MKTCAAFSTAVSLLLAGFVLAGAAAAPRTAPSQPATNAANRVQSPLYGAWAKFKPGTTVTLRSETDNVVNTITKTLKEVTADNIKLETKSTISMDGQPQVSTTTVEALPAMIDKRDLPIALMLGDHAKVPTEISDFKSGKEPIEVAGTKYESAIHEANFKITIPSTAPTPISNMQIIGRAKTWWTAEVPGGILRMESYTGTPVKMDSVVTLVEFKVAK